jgi:hypothetical protein
VFTVGLRVQVCCRSSRSQGGSRTWPLIAGCTRYCVNAHTSQVYLFTCRPRVTPYAHNRFNAAAATQLYMRANKCLQAVSQLLCTSGVDLLQGVKVHEQLLIPF